MRQVYPRCAADAELDTRFHNAWIDSRGYYQWTSSISPEIYESELNAAQICYQAQMRQQGMLEDDDALRFVALIHPRLDDPKNPGLSQTLVSIFEEKPASWFDPCHPGPELGLSLWELWQMALLEIQRLVQEIGPFVNKSIDPEFFLNKLLEAGFSDGDLRSWQRGQGACSLELCQPIDWFELWFSHFTKPQ